MIILLLLVIIVVLSPEILASRVSEIMYIDYDVKDAKKKITKKEALEELDDSSEELLDTEEINNDAEELLNKINGTTK